MSNSDLLAVIADDMRAVDGVIRTRLRSDVVLINTIAEYIVGAGGKRLRPALLLLISGALGYDGAHRHEMAAVVEFIHTATLLHDDVVDESELRRGRSTANASFGNAAAVLVGDFLYSRAFQMMVEPGSMRIMEVLADATNVIAEGEVLQLLNAHDPDTSEQQYLRIIRYKTAKLFEAAARLGAILARAPASIEDACATYGRHLGTAFQLVDDLLDYSGTTEEIGKTIGDDLREGKPTMPLIYLREHGDRDQQALARRVISEAAPSDMSAVVEALRSSGALSYTRACAQRESELAVAAIAPIEASNHQSALLELAAFASSRTY